MIGLNTLQKQTSEWIQVRTMFSQGDTVQHNAHFGPMHISWMLGGNFKNNWKELAVDLPTDLYVHNPRHLDQFKFRYQTVWLVTGLPQIWPVRWRSGSAVWSSLKLSFIVIFTQSGGVLKGLGIATSGIWHISGTLRGRGRGMVERERGLVLPGPHAWLSEQDAKKWGKIKRVK